MRRRLTTSPESAVDAAGRIQDESLRERSLIAVGRTWMRRDPAAAEAWLADSGLSDAARSEITKPRLRRQRARTRPPPPAPEPSAGS